MSGEGECSLMFADVHAHIHTPAVDWVDGHTPSHPFNFSTADNSTHASTEHGAFPLHTVVNTFTLPFIWPHSQDCLIKMLTRVILIGSYLVHNLFKLFPQTIFHVTLCLRLVPALLPQLSLPQWMWWKPGTWTHHQASTRVLSTVPGLCWRKRGQQLFTRGKLFLSDPFRHAHFSLCSSALQSLDAFCFVADLCPHFWGWDRGMWWCLSHLSKSKGLWWPPRRG